MYRKFYDLSLIKPFLPDSRRWNSIGTARRIKRVPAIKPPIATKARGANQHQIE